MRIFQKLNKEYLKDLFIVIENVFGEFGIDFYVIGALARDIMITGKHNISVPKVTLDVDLAVMITNAELYDEIINRLIEYGFERDSSENYRLLFKSSVILDLLPFGGIENNDNVVRIHGRVIQDLYVLGLNEMKDFTEIIEYDENRSFNVTTLPAVCILKLISWNNKPAERMKDIEDFTFILSIYSEINLSTIYEIHPDLLGNGWNPEIISPQVLGRDIGLILNSSPKAKEIILKVLSENTVDDYLSRLAVLMSNFNRKYVEINRNTLKILLENINFVLS